MKSNTAECSRPARSRDVEFEESCRPEGGGGGRVPCLVSHSSLLTRCFPFITSVIELKAEDRSKFLDALVSLLS